MAGRKFFLMKTSTLLLILILSTITRAEGTGRALPGWYPRFSWETVPVYQMFGSPQLLTEEQVRTIAATTSFLCIEKAHGQQVLGAAELGAKHEIAQFKRVNPRTRALFYFNAARAWPFATYSQGLKYGQIRDDLRTLIVKDPKTGELAHKDRIYCFDVLNPAFRKWWTETVAKGVRETGADGLFVDQMHGNVRFHPGKRAEVAAAHTEMMHMAKKAIGADKILMLNNGAHLPALFEVGDAFMFEHFNPDLISKEKIVEDWQWMKKIAGAGKISVWRIGVEHQPAGGPPVPSPEERARNRERSNVQLEAISKQQLDFYLAAFLMGAEEQAYFQYGWGWGLETGPLADYPQFRKPLGRPKRDAHQEAKWIFRREFEHARVRVDLEKREGRIEWNADETTGSKL